MRPLQGLRVVDLTVAMPGPYCATLLSDLGADVVKVERPEGDPMRELPAMFAAMNRGRRSVVADLKAQRGREIVHRLAARADVALEGFRPGVARRLGVDFATLAALNPRLIYCSISGFGQAGPWAQRPAHDLNYLALGGFLGVQARLDGGRPAPPAALISDLAAGLFAALAVTAAVAARLQGAGGTFIDLSMADCVVNWMGIELSRLAPDEGAALPNVTRAPHYDVFEAADGGLISLGIVYEDHFWRRLCELVGLPHLAGLGAAERFARQAELRQALRQAFRARRAAEWHDLLEGQDVPYAPLPELEAVVRQPHFLLRGLFSHTQAADGTASRQVGLPMTYSGMESGPTGPPPLLGQHTAEVLAELGLPPE